MSDRIRWHNLYVLAWCTLDDFACSYAERIENPLPDQQKALLRRAREHARATGHRVSIERGQLAGAEA